MTIKTLLTGFLAAGSCAIGLGQNGPAATLHQPAIHLRIVGGLSQVNQYERNEKPFWTRTLAARTGGRATADIVPFDRAGLRGQEILRLMQTNVVPFGTMLLGVISSSDPEYAGPDLAGLSPDAESLARVIKAYRPFLESSLRERFGVQLLAIYTYPAQVLFCKRSFKGLSDLAGRRVRTSTASQSDFVEGFGATAIRAAFPALMEHMNSGDTDCAITGSMSGNTIGLHEITTHLYSMPITWGLSVFAANADAWNALPAEVRAVLRAELPHLEADIWAESIRETKEGAACNTGASGCSSGRAGKMTEVIPTDADRRRQREIFESVVLPAWVNRCGNSCVGIWKTTLQPVTNIVAKTQ